MNNICVALSLGLISCAVNEEALYLLYMYMYIKNMGPVVQILISLIK